jgi:hypothetical protein
LLFQIAGSLPQRQPDSDREVIEQLLNVNGLIANGLIVNVAKSFNAKSNVF